MLNPILLLLANVPGLAIEPGDASVVAALPPWLQFALPVLGLFAVSLVASFWSDYVRRLGPKAPKWMLSVSFALNAAAGNPHKAARAAKAAKFVPLVIPEARFIPKHAANCVDPNCDQSCAKAAKQAEP